MNMDQDKGNGVVSDAEVPAASSCRLILDLREADEFHEARIPGSINLPLSSFKVQAPHLFAHGRILHGVPVILVCRGGRRAGMAAEILKGLEVDTDLVSVHPGGFKAWVSEGGPVERGGPVSPARRMRLLWGLFALAGMFLAHAISIWFASVAILMVILAIWFGLKNVAPLYVAYMLLPWNRKKYL